MHSWDAIVIGAGVAGLCAARVLADSGLSVLVFEARDRVGGRILTVKRAGRIIELGAEFVHGSPPEVLKIIRAAHLNLNEIPDIHHVAYKGKLTPLHGFWPLVASLCKQAGRSLKKNRRDVSLYESLRHSRISSSRQKLLLNFVEGFEAAYPGEISTRWLVDGADELESPYKQFRLALGYGDMVRWLAAGFDPDRTEIQIGRTVTDLEWKRNDVRVRVTNPAGSSLGPFHARAAILTIPHAVLKAGTVQIRPSIPSKQRALEQLAVGHIYKLVLQFRDNFWANDDFISKRVSCRASSISSSAAPIFIHSQEQEIPVWWTQAPSTAPILTAWAGGPKAEALLAETHQTRLDKSLNALAGVFGMSRNNIDDLFESSSAHDWTADPCSRGAYTYVSAGAVRAAEVLAKPVQKTLFFAGEATDADEMGTVAAAIASGRRAANQCARTLSPSRS